MPRLSLLRRQKPLAPLLGLSLLALAACGTPQERCINRASAESRNLQALLAEVDGNLARGYAYETYEVPVASWDMCGYDTFRRRDGAMVSRPHMCLDTDTVTARRPVPIDPQSEKRKRDALIARLNALRPQLDANLAACRATYPE